MIGLSPSDAGAVQCTVAEAPPGTTVTGAGASGADRERMLTGTASEIRPSTETRIANARFAPWGGVTNETREPVAVPLVSCTVGPEVWVKEKLSAYWLSLPSSTTVVPAVTTVDGVTESRATGFPGDRSCVPSQSASTLGWCG